MLLQPPRLNVAATFTQTNQRMGPRHEGFVEIAKRGNIDLLLHGDSITDWWLQDDANKPVFDKYFGHIRTANFAVSGDTTQGVLWGLKNGEGQGFQPKAVMLMIGTNNTGTLHGAGGCGGHRRHHPGTAEGFSGGEDPDAGDLPPGVPGGFPVRDKIAEVNRIISAAGRTTRTCSISTSAQKFLDEKGVFPSGGVPPRQPAPPCEGVRYLGRGREGQAGRAAAVAGGSGGLRAA